MAEEKRKWSRWVWVVVGVFGLLLAYLLSLGPVGAGSEIVIMKHDGHIGIGALSASDSALMVLIIYKPLFVGIDALPENTLTRAYLGYLEWCGCEYMYLPTPLDDSVTP